MVLPPLTFIVDSIMNLMSGPYHECERKEYHSLVFNVHLNCHMRIKVRIKAGTIQSRISKRRQLTSQCLFLHGVHLG